jgi:hypothetical protein
MRPLSDVVFSIERPSGRSPGSKLVRQTAPMLGLRTLDGYFPTCWIAASRAARRVRKPPLSAS